MSLHRKRSKQPARAFEEVFAEHLDALYRTALRLCRGHEADAEDLLQDSALRSFTNFDQLQDLSSAPGAVFEPLTSYREYSVPEMIERSRSFAADLARRLTVRQFSDRPVPRSIIEACLEAASTAPSGAHLQPWHFVVVSDPEVKRAIRVAAELRSVSSMPTLRTSGWRRWPRSAPTPISLISRPLPI